MTNNVISFDAERPPYPDGMEVPGSADARPVPEPEREGDSPPPDQGKARRRSFAILGGVVALGLVGYGGYSLLNAGYETTDDAYVAGNIVTITSREAGSVDALRADDTESVKRGQTLVDLDPAMADAQLAAAEARLAQAVRAVRSDFSKVDETNAEIVQARAELERARNDLARRRNAAAEGAVSGEELSHAADSVRTAQAALDLAQSRRDQAQSSVQGTGIRNNPDVLAAIAEYRRAAIVRGHMKIASPVDGVVAQRTVQLGQHVSPGVPLMAVVPLKNVWVDANFRETQLADLRVGQTVKVESDAYGGDVTYHGTIAGLSAGSGNAFALLPPQNASGNWIKIVQRLPVRIALDPAELERYPLRVGLSVKVTVDTSKRDGTPVARAPGASVSQQAGQTDESAVDKRIEEIIAANSGSARAR